MHVNHYKQYSHNLGREMEFLVYGHSGRPIVVFQLKMEDSMISIILEW